jgi:glycosyltransferase involved in cell wall biosynthesis
MSRIVNIFSPDYDPYSGYGRKALELVYHLSQMGYHVNALGSNALAFRDKLTPGMIALLEKPVQAAVGGIVLGYPTLIPQYGELLTAGPYIVQTMFESTKLPEGWASALNKAKAVCVPSRWLIDVMKKNGVLRPVYVVAEGVSETFQYVDRRQYPEVFTFLAIGDRGSRKGWDVALKAFHQAFGDDMRYKLIIKARSGKDFPFERFENPNIEVIREDYDEAQMMALYARCHAMIFPSRGEGFGLPPREFAATGGATICTQWSGLADDLSGWGYPIHYKLVPAWEGHDKFAGLGKWAEPDIDHLVKQLRYIAGEKRYKMWHQAPWWSKAEQQDVMAAQKIRKLYDWRKFTEGIAAAWESVQGHTSIKEKRQARKERRTHARN